MDPVVLQITFDELSLQKMVFQKQMVFGRTLDLQEEPLFLGVYVIL